MHAPVMTLLFYALFFAGLGWLIWRSMRDEQPTKPRESSRAPPRDAAPRGSIELADDQSLRRFVPPSFDSPRDLGAMYANPQVTYADATTEIRGLVDESTAYVGASRDAIRDGWYDHTFYLAAWAEKGKPSGAASCTSPAPFPTRRTEATSAPAKSFECASSWTKTEDGRSSTRCSRGTSRTVTSPRLPPSSVNPSGG